MMRDIECRQLACPYCGESIEVLLDLSAPEQSYIEDCEVCCRPMNIDVRVAVSGDVTCTARAENE